MNGFIKTIISHAMNNFPEMSRIEIAALLHARLANSIALMMQVKKSHLNVNWPSFAALPELFDKVFKDTDEYVATIAECGIVKCGGTAQVAIRAVGKVSVAPDYPAERPGEHKHVAELAHAIASYDEMIRDAIECSNELEDIGSEDVNFRFAGAHEQAKH